MKEFYLLIVEHLVVDTIPRRYRNCDAAGVVTRPARTSTDPTIRYGLIASGNTLMRDAAERDNLSRSFNILCFEMRAAEVIASLRSLVSRGICDYPDAHRHKLWQPYAAATAAAYAKELLLRIGVN